MTASDVNSDDEISPRDDRAIRLAQGIPSAEPTTESSAVRVEGQDGVNEVVDVNSGNTRTSPRFHIESTGALPGRGIGDERFLGGRIRTNNNRTSLRSALTGIFISSKRLTLQSPDTELRSVATGRSIHGGSANDTILLRSAKLRLTTRSHPDWMRLIWQPAGKVNLLLGEFRE